MSAQILVCDDTPAKRYVLGSWLRRSGYEVLEAETVTDAIALTRSRHIDLAVLDVHLPDGTGLDVTRAIRADADRAATPVIHVSAVVRETSDKVAALDEGADAYLVDPIDPEELLSTVRALLRTSGARRDAELLASRLARLGRAATRMNVAASVPRLAEATARAAAEVFTGAAVALLREEGGATWRAVSTGPEQPVAGPVVVPPDIASELLLVQDAGRFEVETAGSWADQLPTGAGPWTAHAVQLHGSAEGVVVVPAGADEDDDQLALLLQRLVHTTAVALDNVRALAFEHHTALTLQRSLLPAVLPAPDGLVVAARYLASERRVEVGGDFFDVFEVGSRCFLVMGDVEGHSLEAAVVMAELRYSIRAYAFEGHAPADIVRLTNSVLLRGGSEMTATVTVLAIDSERRGFEAVSAGHLPVVLVRRGATSLLDVRGPLLGLEVQDRPTHRGRLEQGDRLVLYTDGLVERRDEDIDASVAGLAHHIGAADASAEELADDLLDSCRGGDDDVALLVVDVAAPGPAQPRV